MTNNTMHTFIIHLQIHTHIHVNKFVDNACCLLEKHQHVLSY